MVEDILKGTLVRLSAVEPNEIAEATVRWNRDSEYQRLAFLGPVHQISLKKLTELAERDLEKDPTAFYFFAIRTLDGDRMVGTCELSGDIFPHGDAFVGIGIGGREDWNKGYGTDAMKVLLRYAFNELNLRRVSLSVLEHNLRAIRSYETAGFACEGKTRGTILREGQRSDDVYMGILREEWLAKTNQA